MESNDQIVIEPLSFSNLKEALRVFDKSFGKNPKDKEGYMRTFPASLGDKECLRFYRKEKPFLQYYVAIDVESHKVVGTTGLYAYKKDAKDNAFFLGWYCVDPKYRGRVIGGQLLDFIIQEARKRNKAYLLLWTTTVPNEKLAQTLYKKKGFIVTGKEKIK